MFLRRNRQRKDGETCKCWTLEQMATVHSTDVVLPVKGNTNLRLRLVAKPEKLTADLVARMQLRPPSRPKTVQDVVERNRGRCGCFSRN